VLFLFVGKINITLIAGHPSYSVRVINRHNSSDRVLLKGFEGVVCDVAFASPNSNILAAIDSSGNVIIWQLDEIAGNIRCVKMPVFGVKNGFGCPESCPSLVVSL